MSERDSRARITAGRAFARLGIGAAWGLIMVALVWVAAWGGIRLTDPHDTNDWGVAGLALGVALGIAVCRYSRRWIQWLRLRRMGSRAVTAVATVRQVDRFRTYGRAPNRTIYTVWFSWTDSSGVTQMRERQYGFFASGLREFETCVAVGTQFPIRYSAGCPHRFIADVPYTPTMADQII